MRDRRGAVRMAAGVIAAACVPVAFSPGAFAPFGPLKAMLLLVAAALAVPSAVDAVTGLVGASRQVGSPDRTTRTADLVMGWTVVALVLLCSVSTVFSPLPLRALVGAFPEYQGLLALVAVPVVAAAVSRSDARGELIVLRAVAIAGSLVVTYAVFQRMGVDPVDLRDSLDTDRVWSTLGNPANLGSWAVAGAGLCMRLFAIDPSPGWRRTGVVVAAALALVTGWTGTRAAVLGLLAAAVVMGAAWVLSRPGTSRWKAIAAGAGVIALGIFTAGDAGTRVVTSGGRAAATAAWRLELWRTIPAVVAARPLTGWGPSSFLYVWPAYAGDLIDGTSVAAPHNLLFEVVTVAGIPAALAGLLLMLLAVTAFVRRGGFRMASVVPLAAAFAGLLVTLMFQPLSIDILAAVAVLLGLLVRAMRPEVRSQVGPELKKRSAKRSAGAAKRMRQVSRQAAPETPRPVAVRVVSVVMAGLFVVFALAIAGDMLADAQLDRALTLSSQGAPWKGEVADSLEASHRLAMLQPALVEAGVGVAVPRIAQGDAVAYEDVIGWLETTRSQRSRFRSYWMLRGDVEYAAVAGRVPGASAARSADAYANALHLAPGSAEAADALAEVRTLR